MDWNQGYSAQYYATFVDASTWRDLERFELLGGTISTDESDLRASASLDCVDYPKQIERWVRIYLDAKQGQESVHIPLFTGLASSPGEKINGALAQMTLECYSVLKPAEDVLLSRGWYAPAGMSGSTLIRQLLAVAPAPVVESANAPTLQEAIIAEDNETNLSMVGKLLNAIDWRLRLLGDGTIHICPRATEAVARYDALENDAIEPTIEKEQDWYSCPNVFRAVADDVSAVARDDSEKSSLSTVNRGREVWMEETGCNLNSGETIAEYALRRLKEEQKAAASATYKRRFNPDITATDLLRLNYPEQGLVGDYRVLTQSIELGFGGTTSEKVARVL